MIKIGIVCASILLFGMIMPSYSQGTDDNPSVESPREKVEQLVKIIIKDILNDENVIKDSIKFRVESELMDIYLGGLLGYDIDILYDKITSEKIQSRHQKYSIGAIDDRHLDSDELTLIVDEEYVPASKQKGYILCKQGFEEIMKKTREEACVTLDTAIKLVERGWTDVNLNTLEIFKKANYDYKPISLWFDSSEELRDNMLDKISFRILNLRNIEASYSVYVLDPQGNELQVCKKMKDSPPNLQPYTRYTWSWHLDSCENKEPLLGNYTIVFTSGPNTIKETVSVTD